MQVLYQSIEGTSAFTDFGVLEQGRVSWDQFLMDIKEQP